ncbi:endonuclease domain-containing protein [Sphingomonas parva]|uniref:Endonuclease domain-containing protein n=1 Tax=Sphingomonas parva TaxID=2555898 RepID=A0A4Y8ZL90_9SPHN|nr:DUF559 domain-containing protein [Sphingomonas parva]TFI56744.1 endonuclease domain-containing protein [Sphingomonas parva]
MRRRPATDLISPARRLRKHSTDAERRIWRLLRENFREWRFRRQVPLRTFIVDFASHPAKLVIEADGGHHGGDADIQRDRLLADEGYGVLRFWNHDVLGNSEGVSLKIAAALHERHPHPNPPPSRGRE